jgi:predicted O-methyltransferase YrrM
MRTFKKIVHLFEVYFRHGKTLRELSQYPYGNEIITAYLQSKKKKPIDKKLLGVFEHLETHRKQLLNNTTLIDYAVFEKGLKRRVSEICKSAATPKVWSSFFYHLIRNSQSLHVLEIGTNLGISGQYFLSALVQNAKNLNQKGVFTTIEGVKGLCDIAQQRFKEIDQNGLVDVAVHNALYDAILPQIVKEGIAYQIVFVDGNHKYEPTLDYYETLLKTTTDNAIFIFDDINWNTDMQRAWSEILQRKHHAYSIDFYKLGVVVVDKNAKNPIENFKLFLRF